MGGKKGRNSHDFQGVPRVAGRDNNSQPGITSEGKAGVGEWRVSKSNEREMGVGEAREREASAPSRPFPR